MNRWIAKLTLALLSAGMVATPNGLSAYYNSCDACQFDSCCTGSGFEVGLDFIYWKPCVDDLDFGSRHSAFVEINKDTKEHFTVFKFEYRDICPKWEPGVRARLAIRDFLCNLTLRGTYTYLRLNNEHCLSLQENCNVLSESLSSPLLHPQFALDSAFNDISGCWNATYQSGDALFTFPICCNPCYNVMPFFGAAGLFLRQEQKVELWNPEGLNDDVWASLCHNSHFWGAGLKIGTDLEYNLACCLKLFAQGSLSLLAGEISGDNVQIQCNGEYPYYCPDQKVKLHFCDDGACHIVPGYQIQTGLRYVTNWCNSNIGFHLGYEFVVWHNLPQARRFSGVDFPNDGSIASSACKRTLAFQGIFLGANVGF